MTKDDDYELFIIFDRSADNHDEIWDDIELIRAYNRAHRQIQNRLHNELNTMGQRLVSSKNEENQLSKLFGKRQRKNKKPVVMMRMMALTVPIVKQRRMKQSSFGVQPMQQQIFQYR